MRYRLCGILLLSLAGCASRPPMGDGVASPEPTVATSKGAGAQSLAAGGSSAKLSQEDATFVRDAVSCGITQVRIGRLALQRAQEPGLKELGERLTSEHGKANRELTELAARKGLRLPTQADAEEQQMIQELSFLAGAEFDRACERDLVKTHARAIRMFTQAATRSQDPAVREFAKQMLPVLEEHLKIARRLAPASLPGTRTNPLKPQ